MNKSTLIAARMVAGIFALGLAAQTQTAHAQETGILPIRLKVGALLPSSSGTKDSTGSVVPAAEVDVRIPSFLGGSFISAGIQNRSKDGGRLRVIPLTISRTLSPPNPAGPVTGNVYFGYGGGLYFTRGKNANSGESDSKTSVGGFGQIGYQFPSKFFVEAKYQLVAGKTAGLRASGLNLFVGKSF